MRNVYRYVSTFILLETSTRGNESMPVFAIRNKKKYFDWKESVKQSSEQILLITIDVNLHERNVIIGLKTLLQERGKVRIIDEVKR